MQLRTSRTPPSTRSAPIRCSDSRCTCAPSRIVSNGAASPAAPLTITPVPTASAASQSSEAAVRLSKVSGGRLRCCVWAAIVMRIGFPVAPSPSCACASASERESPSAVT
eukprot:6609436-Prymnesium_polylepis.1